MELLVVSKCMSVKKESSCVLNVFHFKGYYLGLKIENITVTTKHHIFQPKKDYLLFLKAIRIKKGSLETHFIKCKEF